MTPPDSETDALEPAYVCRRCDRRLERRDGELACPACAVDVPVVDGIPRFPVPGGGTDSEAAFDLLAPIYETPLWFAPLYRFVGGPRAPWSDRERIADLLALEGGELQVLDVACGTGRITRTIADDAGAVVGVDLSAKMLERARRYAVREGIDDVAFARMSADDLWFDADRFDRVNCSWALHLFPDVDAALAEMHRVLRPDGRFVATVLVEEYVLDVLPVRAVAEAVIDADPFAPGEFEQRLHAAGFGSVDVDRRGATLFVTAEAE